MEINNKAKIIRSVSLLKEHADFLDNNSELSLTKILRSKINEIIEGQAGPRIENNRLKAGIERMGAEIRKLNDEIEKLKSRTN